MTAAPTAGVAAPPRPRTGAAGRQRPGAGRWLLPTATILAMVAVQELLTRGGVLPADYFPPASEILAVLAQEMGRAVFWESLLATVRTWLIALLLATSLGTAVGIVLGSVTILRALLAPVIDFARPIPSVALIPLVILTLGTGFESGLFLAVFAAFWQVLVPAMHGARAADPVAIDTARSYGFTTWQRVRWIQLPSMTPYLATATRLAASTTLILIVTAEIIIGIPGIGQEIYLSRSAGNPARMYAYIAMSGVAGIVLNGLVRRLEQRVARSHGSTPEEAP